MTKSQIEEQLQLLKRDIKDKTKEFIEFITEYSNNLKQCEAQLEELEKEAE